MIEFLTYTKQIGALIFEVRAHVHPAGYRLSRPSVFSLFPKSSARASASRSSCALSAQYFTRNFSLSQYSLKYFPLTMHSTPIHPHRFYNFNKRSRASFISSPSVTRKHERTARRKERDGVGRYRCRTVRKCSDILSTEPKARASSHRFFCPLANNARSQSGIRHRATISRQTIRLSRESTTHPPPLTSIVLLLLRTVFLDSPFLLLLLRLSPPPVNVRGNIMRVIA